MAPFVWAEESSSNALKSIDFRTNKDKEAVIIVELASPAAIVDVKRVQEGLSIDLLNTSVEDNQLYLLDVKDFSTAVDSVEVFRDAATTRLLAHIEGDYTHDYRLTGRYLEVKVARLKPNEKVPDKSILEKEGKLISINFQDIPVRNVLQLIADYNDFNLVVSDSVEGNLTLRLDGVPWQQVLDIILQVKGLDKRVDGNVILVAPKEELDLREKQQLEKLKLEEEIGELSSEIIKVNFAKASDIAQMINGEGNISMLSVRGSMTIDERTNSLLIRELPENIAVIREIVESLDIPVKQVQIEARIVTVKEGNLDELGVRWGFTSINGNNMVGGSIENNLAAIGLYDEGGNAEDGSTVGIDDFLNVNLAAASTNASSIAFQVAKLGSDTLLDLELSALQQESKAEIISSPRLVTTNKKPAYIEQGTEIPYLEASSSGATTITFKKAVLSLKVTPPR
ncbi:type IV pilus secretin PilQ [Vibrio rotiferianus CAIM 577 = LMG 21460]|nr:type IV pilus secretin PilQ [Vibrio rotiferianus CAIM 577 = LMG 21460]